MRIDGFERRFFLSETAESLSHTRTNFQDLKTLGLHNRYGALRSGNFIGVI